MSKLAQKRIHTLLFCQVCYERFQLPDKAPKVLPCQHSFCRICMECLIRTVPFNCPMCRTEQSVPDRGVDGYPTNLTILALLDCYCTLCQSDEDLEQCSHCDKPICTECKKKHAEQMSESALKLLQQLIEEKTTMQCLCNDAKQYRDCLRRFILEEEEPGQSSSQANGDIVRALKRSLMLQLDATESLVDSAETLQDTIVNVVQNGTKVLKRMSPTQSNGQSCDESCGGSCLTQKPAIESNGECCENLSLTCSPPILVKYLNKHLQNVRSHIGRLSERIRVLSNYKCSDINAQIQYLSSLHNGCHPATTDNAKTSIPMGRPSHVTFSPKTGAFHVLDASRNRILVLSSHGKQLSVIPLPSKELASVGELHFAGLAVSSEGQIVLTEHNSNTVIVINNNGELVEQFGKRGSDHGQFKTPMGVCLDKNEHMHVCDWGNERIQVLDLRGNFILQYGQEVAKTDMFCPQFIHVCKESDHVYVSDTQNGRVHIFSAKGQLVRTVESRTNEDGEGIPDLKWPAGITEILFGCIMIADWGRHTINIMTSCGQYICKFDSHGKLWKNFNGLKGLAFGENGHLAICDTLNDRVLIA